MPKLIVAKGDKLDVFKGKSMALTGVDSANGSRILVQWQKERSRVLIRVSLCLSTHTLDNILSLQNPTSLASSIFRC